MPLKSYTLYTQREVDTTTPSLSTLTCLFVQPCSPALKHTLRRPMPNKISTEHTFRDVISFVGYFRVPFTKSHMGLSGSPCIWPVQRFLWGLEPYNLQRRYGFL